MQMKNGEKVMGKLMKGKAISFEEWDETYKPKKNHFAEFSNYEGDRFECTGNEGEFIKQQDNKNIWTIIDCGDDGEIISPGYHIVDRMGYYFCEVAYVNEEIYVDMED